jgi:hypothetical protein
MSYRLVSYPVPDSPIHLSLDLPTLLLPFDLGFQYSGVRSLGYDNNIDLFFTWGALGKGALLRAF